MCNLYSITTNQAAIIALFRVINRYVGNLAPMPGVFPDYPAPVVRNTDTGREMSMMRWGMPPPPRSRRTPVTNIRNTSSPHWRGWLKPENRCFSRPTASPSTRWSRTRRRRKRTWSGSHSTMTVRCSRSAALDRIQGRARHQVKADPGTTSRLWLPDHRAERGGRADPFEGHAADPNHRRGAGRVDACAVG